MPSTYYIMDLSIPNRGDLDVVLRRLGQLYGQGGGLFMPIFNIDKTKVLIQFKERYRMPRELQRTVLQSGDVAWASNLGQLAEWQQDLSSDLIDKTILYLREQSTIDTFLQDVKTAPVGGVTPDIPPDKQPAVGR